MLLNLIDSEPKTPHAGESRSALSPHDLAKFAKLGISAALLAEAGVKRVTDAEARNDFGIKFAAAADLSGLIFPYFHPEVDHRVTARLRRDNPEIEDGEPRNKYLLAWGDGRHLFFPPGSNEKLDKPDMAIVLVESEKAALALTAWAERVGKDILPLALGGCWSWRGRVRKVENDRGERVDEVGPLADLSYCDGRKIFVMFDSNAVTNQKVQHARAALVGELRKRGCDVWLCDVPNLDDVNGPDDLISTHGDAAMEEVFSSATQATEQPAEYSDDALALQFTDQFSQDLRYTAPWARWSQFDGTRWVTDDTLHVLDRVRGVCRSVAAHVETPQIAARISSAQTVYAVERLAKADRRHATTVDQWDCDPMLLNTPGGTVDLRTGTLRGARRSDFMTKITAAAPGDDCPRWLSFLARITGNDQKLQSFLQRLSGYALTGLTVEQVLVFLYGTGANGKSVFLNTISALLGDYAKSAPISTFVEKGGENHPTELAGLHGARLVSAVETEEGRRWAESKVKALTGGDRISARFMRRDFFEYVPQFKLIIAGNHKPGLRTVDEAMKRRLLLVPFTVTVPPEERDLHLMEKLREERGGILQWALDGCLEWQRVGLDAPQAVTGATRHYLEGEDTMTAWIDDFCDVDRSRWTASSALFASWQKWCQENHETPGSQKSFSQNLESHSYVPERTRSARGFRGIGLRVTDVTGTPLIDVTRARTHIRDNAELVSQASPNDSSASSSAFFEMEV